MKKVFTTTETTNAEMTMMGISRSKEPFLGARIEKGGSSKTETLVALLFVLGLDQQFLDSIKLQNDDVGLRLSRLKLPDVVKRKKVGLDDF